MRYSPARLLNTYDMKAFMYANYAMSKCKNDQIQNHRGFPNQVIRVLSNNVSMLRDFPENGRQRVHAIVVLAT